MSKMLTDNLYGNCSDCGATLLPSWFKEIEYVNGVRTGKVRKAVDYLVCTYCMKSHCIDDSFDKPWYYEESWQ